MDIDLNPIQDSSTVTQTDGIKTDKEFLERPELIKQLKLLRINRIVRLTSPAGSGKTSLLDMYSHSLKGSNTRIIRISCLDKR